MKLTRIFSVAESKADKDQYEKLWHCTFSVVLEILVWKSVQESACRRGLMPSPLYSRRSRTRTIVAESGI